MNILQLKASNPNLSTWVAASAGTGKTKILTDRVLRLLLENVSFNKILCLTFTNAATTEMQDRIINSLEEWSKLPTEELRHNLRNTIGTWPTRDQIFCASSLFESYLKTQDRINIYTIHSFCQKILKKFPLESGIPPNFKIIDEVKVFQIIKKLKKQIFDIEPVARFFAQNFHELTINEIFNEIINIKAKILEKKLGSPKIDNDLIIHGIKIIDELENPIQVNYANYIQDTSIKNLIANIVNDDLTNSNLVNFFLTSDGKKKKRIVTKNIAPPYSDLYKEFEIVQDIIYQLDQEAKAIHLTLYSKLLTLIAEKIISEFEIYKRKNGFLDYDDLIIYTQNLLTNSYAKEWVLYKLDGGIDHLLVDEAQDTSKSQWKIIESLIEEFYSGESSQNRTIFVVGDEKQSIFSFQGADIQAFEYMNKFFHEKLSESKKLFETINLDISYRSTKEILTIVDDIFSKILKNNPSDFKNIKKMKAHRSSHSGKIEIWPITANKIDDDNSLIWPIISSNNLESSKLILAEKIATYIKEQLNTGRILQSTGKKISPEDFMILFRTRDDFTDQVIYSLQKAEIDITGLDKIALNQDLGIADLISIAKFVLDPENDLNLATLLKSQIFGLVEVDLHDIITDNRQNKKSIWYKIRTSDKCHITEIKSKLEEFLTLYKNLPLGDFFLYITDVLNYRDSISYNTEIIDEFLKLSTDYFAQYSSGMQNFIYWFEENEISIKKDSDKKNKLRIMTIHGSKGLQAPIVILCDTTKLPNSIDRFIWDDNDEMFSAKSSSYIPEFYEILKDKEKQKTYQEYLRLLYVALTRAEDELIICGYQGTNQIPENCWYNLVKNSMQNLGQLDENGHFIYGISNFNISETETKSVEKNIEIIENLQKPRLFHIKPEILKKNNIFSKKSLEYGLVFHKILEDSIGLSQGVDLKRHCERSEAILPSTCNEIATLASLPRNDVLSQPLGHVPIGSKTLADIHPLVEILSDKLQKRIKSSLKMLFSNNEFIELLKYDLKTELSFGYKDGKNIKIGRIDLLALKDDEVVIVDYKSDLNPPKTSKSISKSYIKQLSFYKQAFLEIYPNKNIICKIIWLETGKLMDVGNL